MGNGDVEGERKLMAVYRRANYEAGKMFLREHVPEVQFPYSKEETKQKDPERARSFLWRAARLGHDKAGERLFNLAASDSEKLNVLVELKTCNVSASIILALAYYDGKEFGIKKNVLIHRFTVVVSPSLSHIPIALFEWFRLWLLIKYAISQITSIFYNFIF